MRGRATSWVFDARGADHGGVRVLLGRCRRAPAWGDGQWNTLDTEWFGEVPWISGLYGYFEQKVDPAHPDKMNSNRGCYIDQMYGEAYAALLGLPRVFPGREVEGCPRQYIPEQLPARLFVVQQDLWDPGWPGVLRRGRGGTGN